jgi:hypothetical protein
MGTTIAGATLSRRGERGDVAVRVTGWGGRIQLWVVETRAAEGAGIVIHYADDTIADALTVVDAICQEREAQGFRVQKSLELLYPQLFLRELHAAVLKRVEIGEAGIRLY